MMMRIKCVFPFLIRGRTVCVCRGGAERLAVPLVSSFFCLLRGCMAVGRVLRGKRILRFLPLELRGRIESSTTLYLVGKVREHFVYLLHFSQKGSRRRIKNPSFSRTDRMCSLCQMEKAIIPYGKSAKRGKNLLFQLSIPFNSYNNGKMQGFFKKTCRNFFKATN